MSIKDLIKSRPRTTALVSLAAAVLIIAAVLVFNGVFDKKSVIVTNPDSTVISEAVRNIKITGIEPIDYDATGVMLKSEFRLLCDRECDDTALKSILNVSPGQDYTIKKVSGKEYRVSFLGGLKANSIYRFETKNVASKNSWAFQTKKTFRVLRTLPGDKATTVPVNTGIEITFSHENFQNIDGYFEIQPKVKGRFEYHKKVAVFVPEMLQENTIYTVTIKKGLGLRAGNEKIEKDYTFRFQTAENKFNNVETQVFAFDEYLYNFTTKAAPALDILADSKLNNASVGIDVLKYQNEDDFEKDLKKSGEIPSWASRDSKKPDVDLKSLQKVASFTSVIKGTQEYWYNSYIEFPEALKEGYYLIKLTLKGVSYYTSIQVNDASTYISVGKDKTLFWVNDAVTGDPVGGASIEGYDKAVKTGSDGLAVMEGKIALPANASNYYFKVCRNNRPSLYAVVRSNNYWYGNDEGVNVDDIYWTYLYLDRGMYLPRDVVRLWGTVKNREDKEVPDSVEMQLYKYEYSYFEDKELPALESKSIKLSKSGTYKDEMELDNLEPGNYYIRIKLKDLIICQRSFEVKEYVKPAYKIDVKPEKNVMFAGGKVDFNLQAAFYEGSPVPGMKLKYYYYLDRSREGTVSCGNDGAARISIDTNTSTKSWAPVFVNLQVSNSGAEEQEISSNGSIQIFPRDTMFEVEAVKEGKKGVAEVKTSLIDLSRIENSDKGYFDIDDYRGKPVNKSINIKVYEKHWKEKVIGDYYDFISKRTEKRYEYYEVKSLIKEARLSTTDGKAILEFPLLEGSDWSRSYYVEVSGLDSKNREIVETIYMYSKYYNDYNSQFKRYALFEESGKDSFKQGEKVNLGVQYGGEAVKPDSKSKTLFLTQKNGLLGYNISNDSRLAFDMDGNYIPNVNIQAVYFDGTNTFIVGSRNIRYDYSEKELKITVKGDKKEYKPGDTANLEVEVRDKNGEPCAAEVNLSVVDEAFFALQNQYVNTLDSLYSVSVSSGEMASYVSYRILDMNRFGGAECGEGGDSGVRAVFKDNAYFDTVITDKDGKAKASFKLPDNLTSWRITYQAITDDLKAGSGKTNIAVKLPFFADVIFNSIFMENDSPVLTARAYGTDLKNGDKVDYEILLENTDGLKKTFNAPGKANLFTAVPFGNLSGGDYSVTVKAKSGTHSDAFKRSFKVVGNILEAGRTKSRMLTDGLKIEGGKTLTTLEFFNKDASLYYQTLNSLLYTWGDRVDQKLCRKLATDMIKKYYGEDRYFDEEFAFNGYQKDDGGIALLRYGSSEPLVTAQIISLAKDEFDKLRLRLYFYGILDNKDSVIEDVVSAYMGLAALDEPVLYDIKTLLNSKDMKLTETERLRLIFALALLGDYNEADARYTDIAKRSIKSLGSMSYFDINGNKDTIIEATSICSVIACKLDKPDKTALLSYISENPGKDLLTSYEKMFFVINSIPEAAGKGSFTYELDGKKTGVTLDKAERYRLVLTAESLGKIRFYDIKGDIAVLSSYKGPLKELTQTNNIVTLERAYIRDSKTSNNFKQSDLVKVILYPKFSEAAPDGYYEVVDVLPCGLRYVEGLPYVDTHYYPNEVSGQKVVFGIYYSKNSKVKLKDIEYFARAVSPGEFTADNAVIKHSNSDAAGFAEKARITINK